MKSQRDWTFGALCWFFLLFNVERLIESINLASFTYFAAFLAGASMLWSRRARELPFGATSAAFVLLALTGRVAMGYPVTWYELPITILEGTSVVLSQYLCLKVAQHTDEFLLISRQLLDVLRAKSVADIRDAEPVLLNEIRRARRHERPLTLVRLCPQSVTPEALRSMVQQMEQSLGREYVIGCISDILDSATKSHDLTVRVGNHLLLMLPETNSVQAEMALARLRLAISERLGINVSSEILEFGVDELTLTGLLDRLKEESLKGVRRPASNVYQLQRTKLTDAAV